MKLNTIYEFWCELDMREYWKTRGLDAPCRVLMLGEISNKPGYVSVVNKEGRVLWGIHAHHFSEVRDV